MEEGGVPIFKMTLKGELRQGARVRRKMLELLGESKEPVPPYRLSKLLVGTDVYRWSPRPSTKVSFVRKALEDMENRGIVEMAGEVPAGKGGKQKTYRLTPLGRMVASFAPTKKNLTEEKARIIEGKLHELQNQRILEFMDSEWNRENFLADFQYSVILEVIKEGISEGVRKFFESYVVLLCEGPVDRSGDLTAEDWANMWTRSMKHSEDIAYARAVLKVLRMTPEEKRGPVSAYLKHWIETDYLESLSPTAEYIRAVEEGGEQVHVLQACVGCDFTNVLVQSVERHFEDIADSQEVVLSECPKCGFEMVNYSYL